MVSASERRSQKGCFGGGRMGRYELRIGYIIDTNVQKQKISGKGKVIIKSTCTKKEVWMYPVWIHERHV